MAERVSDGEIASAKRIHQPDERGWCRSCINEWPCRTYHLAVGLEGERAAHAHLAAHLRDRLAGAQAAARRLAAEVRDGERLLSRIVMADHDEWLAMRDERDRALKDAGEAKRQRDRARDLAVALEQRVAELEAALEDVRIESDRHVLERDGAQAHVAALKLQLRASQAREEVI